jgi:uncharacterized protein YecE (DUF72 family)
MRDSAPRRGQVRVGTASWTDPGFIADWYPRGLPAAERLRWYAEHLDLVEVNSTFYAVPRQSMVASWSKQTPKGFLFDVKLHRLLSRHSTPVSQLPRGLRAKARTNKRGRVAVTPELEEELVEAFLDAIEPLVDSGKLGALLLQLSPSFGPREHSLHELDHLLDLLKGHEVGVELRNRGWFAGEHESETIDYFRKRRVALAAVDAPRNSHFMIMPDFNTVTDPHLAYLRAHGRNARGYISGRTVAERFNYDYSNQELGEIAKRAAKLARLASETHVIFNNNKSSYAPSAAIRFRQIVAERFGGARSPARSSASGAMKNPG